MTSRDSWRLMRSSVADDGLTRATVSPGRSATGSRRSRRGAPAAAVPASGSSAARAMRPRKSRLSMPAPGVVDAQGAQPARGGQCPRRTGAPRHAAVPFPATVARGRSSVSSQPADRGAEPVPARCENCAAVLHGEFCHACGQSVHNPIRHAAHAVEEFFEAFWHLDGRVFRTLRDLMSSGRVAINYLAGHRARYIAPLRLFVILSLLTFFIGAAAVHVEESPVSITGLSEIAAASTVAEVERIRDQAVADIEQARADAGNTPGVDPTLVAAEVRIRSAAANRVVELTGRPAAEGTGDAPPQAERRRMQINLFGHKGEWDAETNPLVIGWWPQFANDWLNRKVGNLENNMQSFNGAAIDAWLQGAMAAAPSALFLLVPVFALLLKLAYLFTRRLYLEHLVVAL